jgi:hypothetical protein
MKERLVHQWRDWILKYVGENKYALIHKKSLSAQTITASNSIDVEKQSRVLITKAEEVYENRRPTLRLIRNIKKQE